MKRVLMIAFHYPPFRGSSSVQRSLRFSEYLLDFGWHPLVLSAHERAYPQISGDQTDQVPEPVVVRRAFALDAARHLSIRGRYLESLALPDRWFAWFLGGVPEGLAMIREYRPDVLWSTYPITTAHLLGLALHRLSGIPWVADFRDPMTEPHYPPQPVTRTVRRWVERSTVAHCTRAVFTAPGAARKYARRYPDIPASRWRLIRNGYDERDFAAAEALVHDSPRRKGGALRLVHSGLLYRSERDPRAFFAALGRLRCAGSISGRNLNVILRASGEEADYRRYVREHGLEEIVFLEPALPYREALAEMLGADGLLVFQAANCNHQIPAKLYECLRAGRPILALIDPEGDTAGELREAGVGTIVPLDREEEIVRELPGFLERVGERRDESGGDSINGYTRRQRSRELAELFESIVLPTEG